jgi:tetratricopeptide (TPR) repeat protein
MVSKRPVILMAILLLLLGWLVMPYIRSYFEPQASHAAKVSEAPLPGISTVSNLAATQQPDGRWMASFDYFYTGEPKGAYVNLYQVVTGASGGPAGSPEPDSMVIAIRAKRGANQYSAEIHHPRPFEMAITTQLYAGIQNSSVPKIPMIAKTTLDKRIVWPDPLVVDVEKAVSAGQPEAIVQRAADLIDMNDSNWLPSARMLLQALVERQPKVDSAYVELARVAMKTNWSTTGLRDAETLIRSALQINPASVNAQILLGYVLAHQERYKDAEPLFVQAATSNPPNLWLWANWGELLTMQGKKDEAISKYREAVTRPPARNGYDRARQDAYKNLVRLLDEKGNLDELEALHKQRTKEYPSAACYSVEYARFLVIQRADDNGSTALLRDVPSPQCDNAKTREVQGLAHYVRWSRTEQAGRSEVLLQARTFLPASPQLFFALASSDRTVPIAQQLIAVGDKVDVQDNSGYDALGYALRNRDTAMARRLLRLGAKPTAEQGGERMPAALIPVMSRDREAIRLMQRSGVDYTKLRYQNRTVADLVRDSGDKKLLQWLDPRTGGV